MHMVAIGGRDPEARERLEARGLNVRPAKPGSLELALRVVLQGLRRAFGRVDRIRDGDRRRRAPRRGWARAGGARRCRSCRASAVRPGMAMFTEDGGYDVVESVERVPLDAPVYDINVEDTHNFVANGLVTHNSIYGFRGADITQHPRVRGRLPRRARRQARAELPLDADHPRRRQRGDRQQPRAHGQAAVDRPRGGRSDQGARDGRRARRGAVRRRRDRAARRRGRVAARRSRSSTGPTRSRGCSRTRWCGREIGYQVIGGTKFYERAEIKDAIAYLTFLVNPQDVGAFSRIANSPAARDRADVAVARARPRRRRWASRSGTPPPSPTAVPGLGDGRGQGDRALHGHDGRAARARRRRTRRSASCWTRCCSETGYLEALEAERTIEAQGRIENLAGARRASRGSTTPATAERHLDELPAADRAARRHRRAARRRGPGDADDAAQRQGPRVPDRVHDRHGGRACSRTRARSTRAASRRSAGSATSASPAPSATSTLTYARAAQRCSARASSASARASWTRSRAS